eukprot:scaffold17139_cov132-Skeletonema_marinoi.AAC.1
MKGCWVLLELGSSVRDSLRSRAVSRVSHKRESRTITDYHGLSRTQFLLAFYYVTDYHGRSRTSVMSVTVRDLGKA